MNRKTIVSCILFLFLLTSKAQFYNLPNDYAFGVSTQKALALKDSAIHPGVQPYIHFYSYKYKSNPDSASSATFIKNTRLMDLLFVKHFIRVKPENENFSLRIDPILNIESGKDIADTNGGILYTNSRGVIASGHIGEKFYFETMFSENQSVFPDYISNNAKATGVIPGQGRWKQFKTQGYDYAFSSGFVSMQALKNLNIQVGHGKHKIGHGYRSLLLSDNAFNYPYARITQQWFKGRVQYTNIYAVLMNLKAASVRINPNTERLFQKKAASFQYLSINFTKWLNVGFFQGLIWKAGDSRNRHQLDWQFYSPVIYTALLTYGFNDRNNVVGGADLNLKVTDRVNIYAQLMIDNYRSNIPLFQNGTGWQAGIKYFDVLGLKNLFFQSEINFVRDRITYTNPQGSSTDQSYSHYNQTLAYTPLDGAELLFIADYKFKRFFTNIRYHIQGRIVDAPSGDYSLNLVNARLGFVINPSYNLNVSLGLLHRTQNFYNFKSANETNYIYLSFRTSIYNLYYDF